uniref:Uncharacterized protein n=1 Tax=Vespula pensylvanica TaxID=30213 RepID=A0A834K8H6_VESPE|nr:hypothetical protein H0235_015402 [Vespula pensylvanica]
MQQQQQQEQLVRVRTARNTVANTGGGFNVPTLEPPSHNMYNAVIRSSYRRKEERRRIDGRGDEILESRKLRVFGDLSGI